jgi:hypothetical protein
MGTYVLNILQCFTVIENRYCESELEQNKRLDLSLYLYGSRLELPSDRGGYKSFIMGKDAMNSLPTPVFNHLSKKALLRAF